MPNAPQGSVSKSVVFRSVPESGDFVAIRAGGLVEPPGSDQVAVTLGFAAVISVLGDFS